jgi:hypothetical protein
MFTMKNKKSILLGGLILGVGIIAGAYWIYTKPSTITTPEGELVEISAEDKRDLKTLAKLYDVPQDIVPLMAKVNDPDALRVDEPVFFKNAQVGDRVAVYQDFAILFDPKEPKLRHVGPVDFGNQIERTIPFVIYNGTTVENAEVHFGRTVQATFNDAYVASVGKAVNAYPKTVVVDLAGDNPAMELIATSLGAEIVELPEGETAPEGAAILVIVGQDFADALQAPQPTETE